MTNNRFQRFLDQARADYQGIPFRMASFFDAYDEEHVVIEMRQPGSASYYLDWVGAERASQPDEFHDPRQFKACDWVRVTPAQRS